MKLLSTLDWVMVAAYFALVFVVAMAVSGRRATREFAEGYFLAIWIVVGG